MSRAAYHKAWADKNREKVRETARKHYRENAAAYVKRATDYQKAHPDQHRKAARRANWKSQGITDTERAEALWAADLPCAICGTTEGRRVVDHDHQTGEVRDILCNNCNRGLGYFGENPEALRIAAAYLEVHG